MTVQNIIKDLHNNKEVFFLLFNGLTEEEYLWKADDSSWCLLELLAHLYDEEREDFRARVKHTAENPGKFPPPIDPAAWVKSRNYMGYDYKTTLDKLLQEREASVTWLKTVPEAHLDNFYIHPKAGKMTAKHFLINWLAHDRLHIRQLMNIKLQYLSVQFGDNLSYAKGI